VTVHVERITPHEYRGEKKTELETISEFGGVTIR
jgi:hypothetical protein